MIEAAPGRSRGEVLIRRFRPEDTDGARGVLAAGFREHFGAAYNANLDPDLRDVSGPFINGVFLVATIGGRIVGTGALLVLEDGTGEVMRMSTAREHRRRGIATAVLKGLLEEARARRCPRVILGTEAAWDDAAGFYRAQGFRERSRPGTAVRFELRL